MTDQPTQPAAAAPEGGTRYLIYETFDAGQTLHLRGAELAGGGDQAIRRLFGQPPEVDGTYVAIATSALKLREVKTKITTSMTEIGSPVPASPEDGAQTAEGDGAERVGTEVAPGETATLEGDGSGTALPPAEGDDGEVELDPPARRKSGARA